MKILTKKMTGSVTLLVEIAAIILSRLSDTFGTLAFGSPLFDDAGRLVEAASYEQKFN